MFQLPRSLQQHIYEYDSTFRDKFKIVLLELTFQHLVARDIQNIYYKLLKERETFYAYLEYLKAVN